MASVWLTGIALVLAGPVPALLARARWTRSVPRAAIVLWQSVAVAAVLAAVGSALAAPEALLRVFLHPEERTGVALAVAVGAAAVLAGLIVVRLVVVLVLLAVRTRVRRARHRDMVDLLARADRGDAVGALRAGTVRVLDGAVPFAYCVPGRVGREGRVVLTGAALDTLCPNELRAVIAHEQAHLDARHDLVREGFTALHKAFPVIVRSREARDTVALLLEMLADDAGRRRHGDAAMAGALDAFASTGRAGYGTDVVERLERIRSHVRGGRALAVGTYLAAVALVVVPTITIVVPWLADALPVVGIR
ncbi:M56 family metallopeptidase [Actinomycetospora corticicola]|uniref:Zn-dependent protease with chaperone function n=1 Tax=Actinomycetospora corticicola TaxID=663602 RepID=A0A7Y9DWD3_9PSEU|nr:M56 family metallopeptidase [Actinomycetospora corticicola]NYD36748.1 Zn-dependent protease with chaperone function [Actinomycetospora corticicola]